MKSMICFFHPAVPFLRQKFANLSVPATVLKCDVVRNEYVSSFISTLSLVMFVSNFKKLM
jgi:hypothetical protein